MHKFCLLALEYKLILMEFITMVPRKENNMKAYYKLYAVILMCFIPLVAHSGHDIKMVITAAFVSERGLPVYKKIAKYISKKMNSSVNIVSNLSYKHSNLLLDKGIVQVGFVCGLPYTQKKAQGKQVLIAIPISSTEKGRFKDVLGYEKLPGKYYSYTIVQKDSKINSWEQLKGASFVYNDQTSNSGYNMPRYKLIKLGFTSWEDYFSKVLVSGSHEESIRMVAQGLVDASSVDSLVLDYDRYLNNKSAINVKVIEALFPGGAGIPPVVMSSKAPIKLREELKNVLLNMHKDVEGKKILAEALLLKFDEPNDSNYDDIRKMEKAAKDIGFRDHQE